METLVKVENKLGEILDKCDSVIEDVLNIEIDHEVTEEEEERYLLWVVVGFLMIFMANSL